MEEDKKNFAAPFVAHNVKLSLERIEGCISTFISGFLDQKIAEFLGRIGISLISSGMGDSTPHFATPLGDIKVEFEKRLENQYLGVAAIFSFKNKNGEDEPFFIVFMNHLSNWVDSSGYTFKHDFVTDRVEIYEFVQLMVRVLAKRLQIQDAKLLAI